MTSQSRSNEEVSKYFSELSRKRKKPYLPFKDNPDYAKEMSLKAVAAKRKKREANTAQEKDSSKS